MDHRSEDAEALLASKFVRIKRRRENGLVEFDFAIGAPEIFVELLMPAPAFEEFCRTNAVVDITGQTLEQDDYEVRLGRVLAGEAR